MTLVMNQLLDFKLIETKEEKGKDHEPTETQEEDTLVYGTVFLCLTWNMKTSLTKKKHQKLM